ncbi:flagellin N-terminal helical domain-containing protein [Quadrisphaera oryzae]|uniref:flagellin N-terminal helical domain-containing protein n=1 Tax=Quadrisphaera TaxID=317661 RepID=UPI001646F2B6|nr:flagellin [Quadrisphaera sp. RL12-1S]MBC3763776.1 flagellin [Quadrisphaera sp. RL12-1S]
MAISVNNNIQAFNTYRNLTSTQSDLSKSLEKLSSGYRINRAADDAAGLAISEGLNSQIQGLTQATRNSQDGINVVQTAEGSLSESTSILQRMRTLAVQASNGSMNADAKSNIQSEVVQLKSELDRIAQTTNFNGRNLLDGSFSTTFQVGANQGQTISVNIGTSMGSAGLGISGVDMTATGLYAASTGASLGTGVGGVAATAATSSAAGYLTFNAATPPKADGTAGSTQDYFSGTSFSTASFQHLTGTISFGGKTFDLSSVDYSANNADGLAADGTKGTADGTVSASEALNALNKAARAAFGLTDSSATPFTSADSSHLKFLVTQAITGFTTTSGNALTDTGATTSSQTQIDNATPTFTTGSGASGAITLIDNAIKQVSTTRANLGAVQNRLEHTIANLGTATQNLTASMSSIKDVDMASEMVKFTSKQILAQAGTAMLSQAKNLPQSVLSLLQG